MKEKYILAVVGMREWVSVCVCIYSRGCYNRSEVISQNIQGRIYVKN